MGSKVRTRSSAIWSAGGDRRFTFFDGGVAPLFRDPGFALSAGPGLLSAHQTPTPATRKTRASAIRKYGSHHEVSPAGERPARPWSWPEQRSWQWPSPWSGACRSSSAAWSPAAVGAIVAGTDVAGADG